MFLCLVLAQPRKCQSKARKIDFKMDHQMKFWSITSASSQGSDELGHQQSCQNLSCSIKVRTYMKA